MIRFFYASLVGLHPRPFRERFGEQMLDIFDEHAGRGRAALVVDALASVFRQWVMRPACPQPVLSVSAEERSNIPAFHTFETSLPRRSALANGALGTLVLFAAISFTIGRGGSTRGLLIGAYHPRHNLLPVDRASIGPADPTTEIKVKAPAVDPLYPVANVYFRAIRALAVLDGDRDRIISEREIRFAPEVLAKLDINNDGTLSPEECGYALRKGMKTLRRRSREPAPGETIAGFQRRKRLEFMRLNPILAAIDTDQGGDLSASEIENASSELRALDRNRDGSLTPAEVIPEAIFSPVASIMLEFDENRDGLISVDERAAEGAEPVREFLERADRNGDGFTSAQELAGELQFRPALKTPAPNAR